MTQLIDETVTVKITRMKQVDNLDGPDTFLFTNEADFESRVTVDGKAFSGKKFEGKDDLNPGTEWTFTNTSSQRFVPIAIKILENDDPASATTVDINPDSGKKDLNLNLDRLTGQIFNSDTGLFLGNVNQTIVRRGAGDGDRGEISFVINGVAGPEPENSVFALNPSTNNNRLGDKLFSGNNPTVTGDFNKDGKTDLVVSSGIDGVARAVFGSSNGLNTNAPTKLNLSNLRGGLATGDINGDGMDDLVLGGEQTVIRFGTTANPLTGQSTILKTPSFPNSTNSRFGSAVTAGDFNGDGEDDVVVGDGFAAASGQSGSGAIQVNYGSSSGFTTNPQVFHRDTPGILGLTNPNANFGDALAAGDINGDGFEDLVVGAPGAPDVAAGAGVFHVIYGSASGLTATNSQLIGQSFSGQSDKTGDLFGAAVAVADVNGDRVADVLVGAPGKNNDAGQIYVYHGRRNQPLSNVASRIVSQPDIFSGSAEAGDKFGATIDAKDINNDGFADVLIGAPGEDNSAGMVTAVFGTSTGLSNSNFDVRILQQEFNGIAGTREAGDRFGTGIAIGNFNGSGQLEAAISAPAEGFGNITNAGMVNIISNIR